MKVEFELNEVVDFLEEYLKLGEVKDSIKKLKGIDWNPFNEDGDEYVGAFEELQHNLDLISDAAEDLCKTVQFMLIGGQTLSNQQKHKAVVKALDNAVRLPFWAEPFDGILFDVIVKMAVKNLKKVNFGVPEGEVREIIVK